MPNDNWFVAHWMAKDVIALPPDAPLADVFDKMEANQIRHIPIVEGSRLIGIVSDRDVARFLPTRQGMKRGTTTIYGKSLMETPVERVMTENPHTTTADTPIRDAAMLVIREKVGALPVVEDERLVGIISSQDLLWAFVDNFESLRSALGM
jgi:acetoin utilization protein AcuB